MQCLADGPTYAKRPLLIAISVAGIISPECTFTHCAFVMTVSAGFRPAATATRSATLKGQDLRLFMVRLLNRVALRASGQEIILNYKTRFSGIGHCVIVVCVCPLTVVLGGYQQDGNSNERNTILQHAKFGHKIHSRFWFGTCNRNIIY